MALEYNVIENKNAYRKVSKEEYENYLKESTHKIMQLPTYIDLENDEYFIMDMYCYQLIFLCGFTLGITEINEMNYLKVFNRLSIHEKLFGAILQSTNPITKKLESKPFTLENVKLHIGTKTNGIYLSKVTWQKNLLKEIIGDKKNEI